jgi:hypothetical protein
MERIEENIAVCFRTARDAVQAKFALRGLKARPVIAWGGARSA